MAKSVFIRNKPHVNVGTSTDADRTRQVAESIQRLQHFGISPIGAQQVMKGQAVTNASDRQQLAAILCQCLG